MDATVEAPIDAVIARVRGVYRGWNRSTPIERMRRDWDALFAALPAEAAIEPVSAGGVNAEWVVAPDARADRAVMYCHGGGYQVGSTRSHRELMAAISRVASARVLGIDYRLAPEHRFPAPLHDALAAHEWLLQQGVRTIAFAGDSAGAHLVLCTLLALRDAGRPLPAAAVLLSAWTDLTASRESYATRADADPIHQRSMILALAQGAVGRDVDARDASPLFADLRGLPPLLMQVGDREVLLGDSTDFADRARAAGVSVQLEVWPRMIHVFQQFPHELAEARDARSSIGAFLRERLRIG